MRLTRISGIIVLIILTSSICYASPLDEAKQVIDDYYRYSTEKDVDSYVELFDQEYLEAIYGDEHKTLFNEIFNYFQIQEYEIDYQYYTESDESMTVFFNLESTIVIEGEKIDMDNDMVAFFTKSEFPELRYILLQEEFIGQMNKEFVYRTAISKVVETENDLKKEAEKEGVELQDNKAFFQEKIAEHDAKHSSRRTLWIAIVIIAVISAAYIFLIRKDILSKHIKDKKLKSSFLHTRKSIMTFVEDKAWPLIKDVAVKTARFIIRWSFKIYKRIKKRIKRLHSAWQHLGRDQ